MTENAVSPAESPRERPALGAADPVALAEERALLAQLAGASTARRWQGYLRLTGPGWLQSAFTLGSGSAVASLYLGAHYGYRLLWVQPLAMIVGIVMLMAASHQTLSTGVRPYDAMRRFIHPSVAWAWAGATLIASFVFHLPQYALAAGVTEDMIAVTAGWQATGGTRTALLLGIGLIILIASTLITWNYGRGIRGIRLYERTLKLLVGMMIVAFFVVVARTALTNRLDWGALLSGFLPLSIPTDPAGATTVAGAFGAAVGINMTFLFGYTLLARGWGGEHRGLAKFDLITGMFLPYVIVTSLIVIACACTIYGTEFAPEQILPANVGVLIGSTGVGATFGRLVFGLGILGMALSTITLQMLVAGFALCELLGIEATGWRYRLCCLLPAPAFLGVILWTSMGTWIALPAFTIGLIMLPIAYIAWFLLHNSSRFLGDDRPRGRSALRWNLVLGISLFVTLASVAYTLVNRF